MTRMRDNPTNDIWITNETPARVLFVKGRSAIDCDCLVAEAETGETALWIVDGMGKTEDCCVCGLGDNVRARKIVVQDNQRPLTPRQSAAHTNEH